MYKQVQLGRGGKSALLLLFSILMLAIATPGHSASRKDCRDSLIATRIQDLDFGTFVVNGAGTVTITPSGMRTSTGGVILVGGSVSPAIFNLMSSLPGECTQYQVRIKLPSLITLSESGGSSMDAGSFVSDPDDRAGYLGAGDYLQISVGATLTVSPGQTPGSYITGVVPLNVDFRF